MRAIVVGTDGTAEAHAAVLRAGETAKQLGATLHLVAGYVRAQPTRSERSQAPADVCHLLGPSGELHELLAEAEYDLAARGVPVRTWWAQDTPSRLMRRVARRVNAELVVCGPELSRVNARRRLWRRAPRHPLAARVAQHATWKVLDLTAPAAARPRFAGTPMPADPLPSAVA